MRSPIFTNLLAIFLFSQLLLQFSVLAKDLEVDQVYLQDGKTKTTLAQALAEVKHGDILILGEIHNQQVVADRQVQLLETLKNNGLSVSVGMEFVDYTKQYFLDKYRYGEISESEFLYQIGWGTGFSFDNYRRQIMFPRACGITTLGLNAPRSLTGKVAKDGFDSLTDEEKPLLPPNFSVGNDLYYQRFKQQMSGHVPESKIINYFMAQSIWDDTMAWRAVSHLSAHPDQVLVIIVGEFHAQYGGGLPDRLRARGATDVKTISFVSTTGLSSEEREGVLFPSAQYGSRADLIWELQEAGQ